MGYTCAASLCFRSSKAILALFMLFLSPLTSFKSSTPYSPTWRCCSLFHIKSLHDLLLFTLLLSPLVQVPHSLRYCSVRLLKSPSRPLNAYSIEGEERNMIGLTVRLRVHDSYIYPHNGLEVNNCMTQWSLGLKHAACYCLLELL